MCGSEGRNINVQEIEDLDRWTLLGKGLATFEYAELTVAQNSCTIRFARGRVVAIRGLHLGVYPSVNTD